MGKAIASTSDEVPKDQAGIREERISGGWDRFEADEKRVSFSAVRRNGYSISIKQSILSFRGKTCKCLCTYYCRTALRMGIAKFNRNLST